MLLCQPNRFVSMDALVDAVWGRATEVRDEEHPADLADGVHGSLSAELTELVAANPLRWYLGKVEAGARTIFPAALALAPAGAKAWFASAAEAIEWLESSSPNSDPCAGSHGLLRLARTERAIEQGCDSAGDQAPSFPAGVEPVTE